MTFSLLSRDDVDLLINLYDGNFKDGWTKNMLLSAFDGGRFIAIGAFDGRTLIGAITCSVTMDDADIEGVVTDKKYRRKGVASALIEQAQSELLIKGVKRILLEVRESNIPAISAYEKQGFIRLSVRKNYYSDGENAVVMVKERIDG
ncbi:MAG: GNAT family N-acetyltransferase [Clostridia bacterium]|nr:GNAT family N-acetyltransferase [Clostridia bacterium]